MRDLNVKIAFNSMHRITNMHDERTNTLTSLAA